MGYSSGRVLFLRSSAIIMSGYHLQRLSVGCSLVGLYFLLAAHDISFEVMNACDRTIISIFLVFQNVQISLNGERSGFLERGI